MALTADGATNMFAQNVLGHVVLLEALLAEDRLGEVAVFAGSEAARGLPKMGIETAVVRLELRRRTRHRHRRQLFRRPQT